MTDKLPEAPDDWLCTECENRVLEGTALTAPHPFQPGEWLTGCPHCLAVERLVTVCAFPTCIRPVVRSGYGLHGYRFAMVCWKH